MRAKKQGARIREANKKRVRDALVLMGRCPLRLRIRLAVLILRGVKA